MLCLVALTSVSLIFAADKKPDWVTKVPQSKEGIYAVGSGKMSSPAASHRFAQAEAVNNLARAVAEYNEKISKRTFWDKLFGRKKEVVTVDVNMEGVVEKGTWTASDGTCYVLVFMSFQPQQPAQPQEAATPAE